MRGGRKVKVKTMVKLLERLRQKIKVKMTKTTKVMMI